VAEVRLRQRAPKEIDRAGIAGPISILLRTASTPGVAASGNSASGRTLFLLFLLFGRHDHTSHRFKSEDKSSSGTLQ